MIFVAMVLPRDRELAVLLFVLTVAQSCSAWALDGWKTKYGLQIMQQDPVTNGLMYSMCNSNSQPLDSTPIFPMDPPFFLNLTAYAPKPNTALTGQGWWVDGKLNTTVARVFYQALDGCLIDLYLECDWPTGRFDVKGAFVISNVHNTVPPHPDTGLASANMGSKGGIQVYYHDHNRSTHVMVQSERDRKESWEYGGLVTRDRSRSKTLFARNPLSIVSNVTLTYIKNSQDLGVVTFHNDSLWYTSYVPHPFDGNFSQQSNADNNTVFEPLKTGNTFDLQNFTGQERGIAITMDKAKTRNIFYVGSDRRLKHISNSATGEWKQNPSQSEEYWPVADEAGCEIASGYDEYYSVFTMVYMSGLRLKEVRFLPNGTWKTATNIAAVSVTTTLATATGRTSPSGSLTSDNPKETSAAPDNAPTSTSPTLTRTAIIGIGVGAAIGAVGLFALGTIGYLLWRRRRAADSDADADQAKSVSGHGYGCSSPSIATEDSRRYWLPPMDLGRSGSGRSRRMSPLCEMQEQLRTHEMAEQVYSHELLGESRLWEQHAGVASPVPPARSPAVRTATLRSPVMDSPTVHPGRRSHRGSRAGWI